MTKRKYYQRWLFLLLASLLGSCSPLMLRGKKEPRAMVGKELKLEMMVSPQISGPCLASLIGPPSEEENCLQWNDNIDGAPTYEPSRRLIFVGAGDSFLYVLDADTGRHIAQIATEGRVITDTLIDFDSGLMYFGTDKGVLSAHDAYSYQKLFSFQADSKIANDLLLKSGSLYFSTGLATVYRLDASTGTQNWYLARPLSSDRLKLSSNSNLIFMAADKNLGFETLVAPHPDGYLSILDAKNGKLEKQVSLSTVVGIRSFPDIIAPMLIMDETLWVASFSAGLLAVDVKSWQVREKIDIVSIHQLANNSDTLYAASDKSLYAIKSGGRILWQNNFHQLRTRVPNQGFPFLNANEIGKRVFLGLVSRLLIRDNQLIMATSLGAMGSFDLGNGHLAQVVGNSLGFSPKISFGGNSVLALTRRGSVVRF